MIPSRVLEIIRTSLVVRMDLIRAGGGAITDIHAVVFGGWEDDDGRDIGWLEYRVERSIDASPLQFDWSWLKPRAHMFSFVEQHMADWPEEWREDADVIIRQDTASRGGREPNWRQLPTAHINSLLGLSRLQGALGEMKPPSTEELGDRGVHGEILANLQQRLQGLIHAQYSTIRVLNDFTRFT